MTSSKCPSVETRCYHQHVTNIHEDAQQPFTSADSSHTQLGGKKKPGSRRYRLFFFCWENKSNTGVRGGRRLQGGVMDTMMSSVCRSVNDATIHSL